MAGNRPPTGTVNGFNQKKYWDYWKNEHDIDYDLKKYHKRSQDLVAQIISLPAWNKSWDIMELGSNIGRNLAYLYQAGFHNLFGIEINDKAVDRGKELYPFQLMDIEIFMEPIEDILPIISGDGYHITYSMGVLMHIPPYNIMNVLTQTVRTTSKYIILMELHHREKKGEYYWIHNYRKMLNGIKFVYTHFELSGAGESYVVEEDRRVKLIKEFPIIGEEYLGQVYEIYSK